MYWEWNTNISQWECIEGERPSNRFYPGVERPWGWLTMTTTTTQANLVPCAMCGAQSTVIVYDYSETELGKTLEMHRPKAFCEIHCRPAKMYFLDGHVEDVWDVQCELMNENRKDNT